MDYSKFTKQQLVEKLMTVEKQLAELTGKDVLLENLVKSEKKYIDLYDNSPDMFFSVDTKGRVLSVNKTGAEQLGYTKDELVGDFVWPVVHQDDLGFVKQKIAEIVKKKLIKSELEFRKVRKDGSELFVHERTQLLLDKEDKIKEIRINCRDITARKIAQDALLKEEVKYRTLTENLNAGIYRSSPAKNGKFVEVNPAFLKIVGYKSKKELFKHNVSDLYLNPKEREKFFSLINKNGFVKNKILQLKRADGEVFFAEVSTVIVRDKKGTPMYYDGIVEDITERRKSELSIKEKEYQYQTLFTLSPSGIVIEDEKGTILEVNPAFCELLGYKAEELLGQKIHVLSHPDAKRQVDKNIKTILAGQKLKHVEKSITKDGTPIYVELNERKFTLPNGKNGIICIAENITQRLNAENQLKQEHNKSERLRKFNEVLISATPYPIYYKDAEGKYLGCNSAFTEQLGYTSDEIKGKTVHELWPSELAEVYHQRDLELLQDRKKQVYEWKLKDKHGEERQIIYSKDVFYDEVGNVAGMLGAYMDITDRKQAEDALRESETKYRLLVENITDLIVKIDTEGKFLFVSHSYCKLFGKTEQELLGSKFMPQVHNADKTASAKALKKVFSPPYHSYAEERALTKKGWRWLAWVDTAVLDKNNKVIEIVSVGRDITERKTVEEALIASEVTFRGLFDNATDAIYILDSDGTFLDVNQGAVKMYGYPREFFVGKTPEFLSAPGKNDLQETMIMIEKAFKGEPQKFEFWGLDSKDRVFPKDVRLYRSVYFGKEVVITFAQDITERKKAEFEMQQAADIFNNIQTGTYIYHLEDLNDDRTLRLVLANPASEKLTNVPVKDIVGKTLDEIFPGLRKAGIPQEYANVIRTGVPYEIDEIIYGDDRVIESSFSVNTFPLPDQRIGVSFENITERKKAEISLRENESKLRRIFNAFPDIFFKSSADGIIEEVSPSIEKIAGYKPEDVIGKPSVSFYASESDHTAIGRILFIFREVSDFDTILKTKDGQLLYCSLSARLVFDEDNQLMGTEGVIRDISDRKKSELEIRKLSRSVEQSPVIVVITDLDAKIQYVNPRFSAVTGYRYDEVKGKNPSILKSGKTSKETYTSMWQTIKSGKDWNGELLNKKKSGELYWESAHISPLKNEDGKISHFIGLKEDISKRKQMEQDLISAKLKAEESDKLKSAFLANMSHEIRTPMNAIIGFSQLLNDPDISDEERFHYISLIQNSGNDLLGLIDDIIDISKIEAGQIKIFKSQYFIDNILNELQDSYKQLLRTKHNKDKVELKYRKPSGSNKVVIFSDIDRLKQIFRNLLSNAIKFTDFGLIEFGFTIEAKTKNSQIKFYVRDTGIGIPKDKLDLIFESFRQVHASRHRLYGGTGLGLAITKKMVEILGGEIWAESTPGQGSTFYFTLPFEPIEKLKPTEEKKTKNQQSIEYNWKDKKILIVEDDQQSIVFYESALRKSGIEIHHALNGIEAVKACKQIKFDLVLMDVQLPEMDGYEATKQIRKQKNKPKIIAQTAYALSGEKQKCLEVGCNDYISKPIKISSLLKLIDDYLKK